PQYVDRKARTIGSKEELLCRKHGRLNRLVESFAKWRRFGCGILPFRRGVFERLKIGPERVCGILRQACPAFLCVASRECSGAQCRKKRKSMLIETTPHTSFAWLLPSGNKEGSPRNLSSFVSAHSGGTTSGTTEKEDALLRSNTLGGRAHTRCTKGGVTLSPW
ncbi:unnamed protein product, partial [Ectocarpus sp. 4 AP-2014]